ncbi:MAG: hypothetical protein KIS96_02430 [Bauldia sp.]|nr:hypothetical protein [Bauldia sp.]
MTNLVVRVTKGTEPRTTIRIPLGILRIASSLVPKSAAAALKEDGVDLEEIVRLSENPDFRGEIAAVEDHVKGEKTVVSVE